MPDTKTPHRVRTRLRGRVIQKTWEDLLAHIRPTAWDPLEMDQIERGAHIVKTITDDIRAVFETV